MNSVNELDSSFICSRESVKVTHLVSSVTGTRYRLYYSGTGFSIINSDTNIFLI